jgi:hypothetical protein
MPDKSEKITKKEGAPRKNSRRLPREKQIRFRYWVIVTVTLPDEEE